MRDKIARTADDNGQLLDHLSVAVDRVVAAYLLAGGTITGIPVENTIDTVFASDHDIVEARSALSSCLEECNQVLDSVGRKELFYRLEEALNAMAGSCVEAGLRVGLTTGCRGQTGEPILPTHGPNRE